MATEPDNSTKNRTEDPRVSGIATVGWITLASLALCIPIVTVSRSLLAILLPLAIVMGAGLMAVRIWSSGEKQVNQKENEALRKRIAELDERLANLEMIDSLEAHFAEKNRLTQSSEAGSATMGPRSDETAS